MYMITYYIILQNPNLTESRMNLMGKISESNALLTLELFSHISEIKYIEDPQIPIS